MKPVPLSRLPFAKQPYRKLRRKRMRQREAADRAFQTDVPPEARCMVPNCPNKPGKHHRIRRRHGEYRYDDRYAMLLCWDPHHDEIERIGETRFCEKYGLTLPELPERFKAKLFRFGKGSTETPSGFVPGAGSASDPR